MSSDILLVERQVARDERIVKTGGNSRVGSLKHGPVSLVGNDACQVLACVFAGQAR